MIFNLNQLNKKTGTIIFIMVFFVLIIFVFTFTQPFKYSSSSRILVIHSFQNNVDPYIASRSNEYLSNILTEVIYSASFFDKVNNSGFGIDKKYFGDEPKKQMENWSETVNAKAIADSGIISLEIYHPEKEQADYISRAIIFSLKATHKLYHGYSDNVSIKIIDKPLVSEHIVKPNIVLNLVFSIILGIVFSFIYIYLFPEEKYNLRLWSKRKNKVETSNFHFSDLEDNWESINEVLNRKEFSNHKDDPEMINDENNFGQSSLDIK